MTIFGWDMSHFDSPSIGNAVSQGIQFLTHKAGGDKDDAELAAWWNGVKGQRPTVLLGAYWVLYPGNPAGRADAFLTRLDSQCPDWRDGPFILQADCEKWNGNPATVPSVSEINAFCDRLAARMPKLNPIAYAPQWVYGNKVSALRYPLWASAYVTGSGSFKALYPGDSSSRWAAYGGRTPSILQYSSSATIGGQTTSDANAFRGTLAELTALLAPGWTTREKADMNLTDKVGSEEYPSRDVQDFFKDFWGMRDNLVVGPSKTPALPAGSPLAKLLALPAQVAALTATVTALAGKDFTDEAAIVAGVLAGLSPEAIAAAIPSDLAEQVAAELARRLQD